MGRFFVTLIIALFSLLVNSLGFHRFEQRSNKEPLKEQWFEQKLCHFSNETKTWKQRFWNNPEFYDSSNEIQFLWVGGEALETSDHIQNKKFPLISWAKKLKANLWNLEHRFYGESHPTPDTSVSNLKYLTAKQALADLANFIKAKNKELKFKDPKRILIGGSYPGNLALWFKRKYPNLVKGVVGSLAPMHLQVEFKNYFRTVEEDYKISTPGCSDAIKISFQRVQKLLNGNKEDHKKLDHLLGMNSTLINAKFPLTEGQLGIFHFNLTAALTTQMLTPKKIAKICEIFMNKSVAEPITRLVNARKLNGMAEFFKISLDYEGYVKGMKDTSYSGDLYSYRLWFWQCCSEFGKFQTIDKSSIFVGSIPLSYSFNFCKDVYGDEFTPKNIKRNVQKATEYYGSIENYNATNVVFSYGSLDPWSKLGLHKTHNSKQTHILINGTSHCADLRRLPAKDDPKEFSKAQETILKKLKEWTK